MAYFRISYMEARGGGNVVGASSLEAVATILKNFCAEEIEAKARDGNSFVVGQVWKEEGKFKWFCHREGE